MQIISLVFCEKKETALVEQSLLNIGYAVNVGVTVTVKGLILVFLSSLVLFDEFVLYITWNEFVALKLHGEGSTTTSE